MNDTSSDLHLKCISGYAFTGMPFKHPPRLPAVTLPFGDNIPLYVARGSYLQPVYVTGY